MREVAVQAVAARGRLVAAVGGDGGKPLDGEGLPPGGGDRLRHRQLQTGQGERTGRPGQVQGDLVAAPVGRERTGRQRVRDA